MAEEALTGVHNDMSAFEKEKSKRSVVRGTNFDQWLTGALVGEGPIDDVVQVVGQAVGDLRTSYQQEAKTASARQESAARAEENRKGEPLSQEAQERLAFEELERKNSEALNALDAMRAGDPGDRDDDEEFDGPEPEDFQSLPPATPGDRQYEDREPGEPEEREPDLEDEGEHEDRKPAAGAAHAGEASGASGPSGVAAAKEASREEAGEAPVPAATPAAPRNKPEVEVEGGGEVDKVGAGGPLKPARPVRGAKPKPPVEPEPVRQANTAAILRRVLSQAPKAPDSRAFDVVMEEMGRLEGKIAAMTQELQSLKGTIEESGEHHKEIRNLLQAKASLGNILPEVDTAGIEDSRGMSGAMPSSSLSSSSSSSSPEDAPRPAAQRKAERKVESPRKSARPWMLPGKGTGKLLGVLGGAAALLLVVGGVALSLGGGSEAAPDRAMAARRAMQFRANYLRGERHELEVIIQAAEGAGQLLQIRTAQLDALRLKDRTPAAQLLQAEAGVKEAQDLVDTWGANAARARGNLTWVEMHLAGS